MMPPMDSLPSEYANLEGLAKRLVAMEEALAVQSEACRNFAQQLSAMSMHWPASARQSVVPLGVSGAHTTCTRSNGAPITGSVAPILGSCSSARSLHEGTTNLLQSEKPICDQRPEAEHAELVTRRYHRRRQRHKKQKLQESIFPDAQKMIDKLTWSMTESSYDVANFYKTEGIFQSIARSDNFETVVLVAILVNVLWIAYDVDYNPRPNPPSESPLLFKTISNAFCVFFLGELLIRFMAFKHKVNWIRDPWCVFDSIIVVCMLFELYVEGSVVHGLRLLRGLRLVRLVRMFRIFKYCSEMMTVVRGIGSALRAITVIGGFLTVIIYLCGVGFRIILEGTNFGSAYFKSVPMAMSTLLLDCTLSGSKGVPLIKEAFEENFLYAVALLMFVLLSAITVMGVLTGLLVQTVKTVADVEKEEQTIRRMTEEIDKVWSFISQRDSKSDAYVTALELTHLSDSQEMMKVLRGMDVDPDSLRNVSSFVLEEHGSRMTLPQFKRVLLDLRGKNVAKVRDHVETRKFIRAQIQQALPTSRLSLGRANTPNTTDISRTLLVHSSSESDSEETESDL